MSLSKPLFHIATLVILCSLAYSNKVSALENPDCACTVTAKLVSVKEYSNKVNSEEVLKKYSNNNNIEDIIATENEIKIVEGELEVIKIGNLVGYSEWCPKTGQRITFRVARDARRFEDSEAVLRPGNIITCFLEHINMGSERDFNRLSAIKVVQKW